MGTVIIDGRVKVSFVPSIASISAPTTTELNAGTQLQGFITPDGLDIGMETGNVNNGNLGSKQSTSRAGRKKPSGSIAFHCDSPTNTPYNIAVYRATGFLVIRRGVDATTAWASTDKVEVYAIEFGEAQQEKPGEDKNWDFTAPLFFPSDCETRAVVA